MDQPAEKMSGAKYKDWILETIDQLRKRKARPDLERICHMVERKHGISFEETEADLEKLVDSEIVIKVDYKGSTSYRNAAKWRKSHLGGQVLNSNEASRKLHSALRALQSPPPNKEAEGPNKGGRTGVTVASIEKWLAQHNQDTNLTKNHLNNALAREVESGRFEKLPDGSYVIGENNNKTPEKSPAKQSKSPAKSKSAPGKGNSAASTSSPSKKGRPSGGGGGSGTGGVIKRKVDTLFSLIAGRLALSVLLCF